jgi:hypothetical protein
MSTPQTPLEKKYWKIRAALEELLHVTDADVEKNPDLRDWLHCSAQLALKFQTEGADAVFDQSKSRHLQDLGIAILRPLKKPD